MTCKRNTSFCPSEPMYHRLLIDLLGKAQQRAAAQAKEEEDATDSTGKGEEREAKRPKLSTTAPPLARVEEEPADDNDDYNMGPNEGGNTSGIEEANSGGDGNGIVWFLYLGQPILDIPRNITHLRIDPSVKVIGPHAFEDCKQLVVVELCEGLGHIGQNAFCICISLKRLKVPSTVKVIGYDAFHGCKQLEEVELCEGLEKIGEYAFCGCTSLKRFKAPSTLKKIGENAFYGCAFATSR